MSRHKRPLATHMRGAILAFLEEENSHNFSVRDRTPQLCIDRIQKKEGKNQGSDYVQSVHPFSRHAMVPQSA